MADREKVIDRIRDAIDVGVCVDLFMDILALLKEQQQQIWEFQDQVEYLTDKQKEQKFLVDSDGKITPLPVVVRCKDCKHFTEPDENGFGVCMKIMHGCQSWGFCADGERKEDNDPDS